MADEICNPWAVTHIDLFNFLCCPECVFRSKEISSFQSHAVENHPKSKIFFCSNQKETQVTGSSSDTTTNTLRSITKRELLKILHKKGSTPCRPKASSYVIDVEDYLLQRFRISPDSDEAEIIHTKAVDFSVKAKEKWKASKRVIDKVLNKNTGEESRGVFMW